MDPINVGVIGSGMSARVFHIPVIAAVPALRLRKIVDRHAQAPRTHGAAEVVRDVDALLQDGEIALVVVATPNTSHFDLARRALLAGKHVVVEKPFTVTSHEAQQLIDLAHAQGRLISVYHNRRWDGDFQTVRQVLASGLLGRLVEYECHYDRFRNSLRPGAWREEAGDGSGILFDLGAHLIDQALVLFGLPQMIYADVRIQREGGKTDDSFELVLYYEGLKATLKGGMLVREPGARFSLHGTEGSFVKHGLDPQEEALKRGLTPDEPHWGEEPRALWGTLNTQLSGLHVEGQVQTLAGCYPCFYRNLADAIAGRAELAVKPEAARDTIRVIELALQSSRQRCALPFA